jgi:Leucine-rich repeat (LRR) protein
MDIRGNEVLSLPPDIDSRTSLTDLRLGNYVYQGSVDNSAPDIPPPAVLAGLLASVAERTCLRSLAIVHSRLGRALPSGFDVSSALADMAKDDSEDDLPREIAAIAGDGDASTEAETLPQAVAKTESHPQGGGEPTVRSDESDIEHAHERLASESEEATSADAAKPNSGMEEAEAISAAVAAEETRAAAAASAAANAAALDAAEAKARAGPCSGLSGLTQLGSLDLSSNLLVWLPVSLMAPLASSLRRLHLCDNCLAVVPGGVTALVGLEELALSRNLLCFFPAQELAGLTRLQRLDLSWNRLSSLECPGKDGRAEGAGMEAMSALTSLNVQVRRMTHACYV